MWLPQNFLKISKNLKRLITMVSRALRGLQIMLMITIFSCSHPKENKSQKTIIIQSAAINNRLTDLWLKALITRMSKSEIDSFALLERALTTEEKDWKKLFESRATTWNKYRDSLGVPFEGIVLSDTVKVMTGFLGVDDAFTYENRTICFDLTAFSKVYGKASLPENENKADRIFCHEYSHLLHKAWAQKNKPELKNFRDSVLWECLYEGIGMYRSLTQKWMPVNGTLPQIANETIKELYPQFVQNIAMVEQNQFLTEQQRKAIRKNLSRGSVNKKWGATSVALWFCLESNGNDKRLIPWINKGPEAVLLLAEKYLDNQSKEQFKKVLAK
jgi:hypothetical protein